MTDSRNQPDLETLDYRAKECPDCETPGYCGQILSCPKCGKTFPLYMKKEFSGHIAGCPTETSTLGMNSHVIKPESRVNKGETDLSNLPGREHHKDCECGNCSEQPNLKIIEDIEGLISQVNDKLENLGSGDLHLGLGNYSVTTLRSTALEEIDLFQKTTLFELRRAFE